MALSFYNNEIKPSIISLNFRNGIIPTLGYIKGNKFYIDLKAIPKTQLKNLVNSIQNNLK